MSEEVLTNVSHSEDALAELLFQRLSPMLVLRILPLKAFNHSSSKELYGGLLDDTTSGQTTVSSNLIFLIVILFFIFYISVFPCYLLKLSDPR